MNTEILCPKCEEKFIVTLSISRMKEVRVPYDKDSMTYIGADYPKMTRRKKEVKGK
jgi:hypothetical protein